MNARNQYLKVLQEKYLMAKSRKEKSATLDEFCGRTGENREYVMRKKRSRLSLGIKERGRKPVICDGHVKATLAKAHLRGQNKVRTFWENAVDEIEIPIFDIPV